MLRVKNFNISTVTQGSYRPDIPQPRLPVLSTVLVSVLSLRCHFVVTCCRCKVTSESPVRSSICTTQSTPVGLIHRLQGCLWIQVYSHRLTVNLGDTCVWLSSTALSRATLWGSYHAKGIFPLSRCWHRVRNVQNIDSMYNTATPEWMYTAFSH